MSHLNRLIFLLLLASFCVTCNRSDSNEIAINQVQVIGSHNSYKQPIEPSLLSMLLAKDSSALGLDYGHLPIQKQLDLGIRGLEIDVLHDPDGGRYKSPVSISLLKEKGIIAMPYDTLHQLEKGGLKVIHVPDIDFRSHCLAFKSCLQEIKAWSDSNPGHVPIIVTINPKESGVKEPGFTPVLHFTTNVLDSLDQEILSVFPISKLITPDLVQGNFSSLREAVTTSGWPSLNSSKGKILFVFDAGPALTELYIQPSLKGKPMFPNVDINHQYAGFFIMNDPKTQHDEIQRRVREGFMVRTRADADTKEARSRDFSRLEAAISSGAQLISTDYYLEELSPSHDFQVAFKDGKFQSCNPIVAPAKCKL